MTEAWIVQAVRSPIGRAHPEQGIFRFVRPDDLSADILKNLVERLRLSDSKRVVYVVLAKVVSGKLTATDDSRNDLWRRHIHSLSDASVWLYL